MNMENIIASSYQILERIGSGGGGVVYLANHIRLNKKVVLKADKRKITSRPEVLRREVDALKNLSHTYIPQVYDFFVEDDTVYTVIDYIEGESLDKPLKRGEKFSQAQVIKWACQVLQALVYLHSPIHGTPPKGIVHSDIKPANIMLTPNGDICLIDFNIALALGEENVVGLSIGYSSPEHYGVLYSNDISYSVSGSVNKKNADDTVTMSQSGGSGNAFNETVTMAMSPSSSVSSAKKIVVPDARSDIYSLGATLYHLLTGVRPAKFADDVIPLSEKDFSPVICRIISKAMNADPNMRYQTADEMLYDLTHLREIDPRTKRRKKVCAAVCTALSVLFIGGGLSAFWGLKRIEITQRSLTNAEYSANALNDGNTDLAVEYALEALTKKNVLYPDYTEEAQKALADALGVYDLSDGYKAYHTIELPSETIKIALSPNGETGAAVYSFAAAVFDTETGQITAQLPMVKSALGDVVFADDNTLLYAGENGLTAYNTETNTELWTGRQATHIAVSADGGTIAGIYRDENFAVVYDSGGNEKTVVSFEGSKQRVLEKDTFADPFDNLLAVDAEGKYIAASFENGGLELFNINSPDDGIIIYDESEYYHFEGGFNGKYFVFSASNDTESEAAIIDTQALSQTIGIKQDSRIGVQAGEDAVYLSNKNLVVHINPETGEQTEMAYVNADVRTFCSNASVTMLATTDNDYMFYDEYADVITQYNAGQTDCNFVYAAGDFAVAAGRDTPVVRILKKKSFDENNICTYDADYDHDEARINADGTRLMLFSYKGFRIYDMQGGLINDVSMSDAERIYDQQFSKKSGNLAVMYNDAFILYSGENGDVLYSADNLKSVRYAPYGVSISDSDGNLKLIDLDTAEENVLQNTDGNFAEYYGVTADDDTLGNAEIIGAGNTADGYYFAAAENNICSVYNGEGAKLFEVPMQGECEVFFTDSEIILSPFHGTPAVYSLKNGKKITDLEKDTYLAYIVQLDDYIISDYISASGQRYAVLLDRNTYKPLANMPYFTDSTGDDIVFDYHKGELRHTRIYPIYELINLAEKGGY